MRPKKLAIIGCGAIARAHVQAAVALDQSQVQILALCDADTGRAESLSEECSSKPSVYGDVSQMMAEISLDAVIICTPPSTHFEIVCQCLTSGVGVLCEKPITIDSKSAWRLVEMAKETQTTLRTASKYRFTEGVRIAKDFVQAGKLGVIQSAKVSFGGQLPAGQQWRLNRSVSGGGVLIDNGPHAVDIARFLFEHVELAETRLTCGLESSVEIEAALSLVANESIPFEIELSWQNQFGETFLQIDGSLGKLLVNWNDTIWVSADGAHHSVASGYNKQRAFTRQLETFLKDLDSSVPDSKDAVWNGEDGAHAVDIIESSYALASCDYPS